VIFPRRHADRQAVPAAKVNQAIGLEDGLHAVTPFEPNSVARRPPPTSTAASSKSLSTASIAAGAAGSSSRKSSLNAALRTSAVRSFIDPNIYQTIPCGNFEPVTIHGDGLLPDLRPAGRAGEGLAAVKERGELTIQYDADSLRGMTRTR
jgi:hypothetical protein